MKVSIPGMETVQSDHFLCHEKVSFSLVSAQKDYLPSLRLGRQLLRSVRQLLRSVRQLSFFSTTAENEAFPQQMKQVFTSVPSLGLTFLGRGNIYSHWQKALQPEQNPSIKALTFVEISPSHLNETSKSWYRLSKATFQWQIYELTISTPITKTNNVENEAQTRLRCAHNSW